MYEVEGGRGDGEKGPGMSLMGEKYRRCTAVTTMYASTINRINGT